MFFEIPGKKKDGWGSAPKHPRVSFVISTIKIHPNPLNNPILVELEIQFLECTKLITFEQDHKHSRFWFVKTIQHAPPLCDQSQISMLV